MKQNQQNSNIFWIASFFAMTLCTMVSCTKEIEFKGEQIDPKLVINSLVEPGQPVKAYISKSIFFLDNEGDTQAPADVVATLYVNGNRIGEMTRQTDSILEGYEYVDWDNLEPIYKTIPVFVSEYCPNEGDWVKITASANGFDDVEATTSALPNEVAWSIGDIQTIERFDYYEVYEYEEDTVWVLSATMNLFVEITDPNPGKTDYFKIQIADGMYTDEENYYAYISASYDDPVFGATVSDSDIDIIDIDDFVIQPEGVFTDALFDGRSYQIKFPLSVYVNYYRGEYPDFLQVPIRLEHLSKEYYYYLNTCEQGSEIMQLFAEPVQTYSNVNDGYGIVGGRMVDTTWFALPMGE